MRFQRFVICALGLAAAAYYAYALATGSGLVGWFNAVQQGLFGAYSLKLSALALTAVMGVAGVAAWIVAAGRGWIHADPAMDRALFGSTQPGEPAPPPSARAAFATWAVLVALTWAVGCALYFWNASVQRGDAAAHYEVVVLADPAADPPPTGSHVALHGQLLGDAVLTHRRGKGATKREDFHLVPIVAPGWRPGDAAHYIVKVERLGDLREAFSPPRRPGDGPARPPVLAALDGEVPLVAADEFRRIGVPLAPGSRLVRWVPSRDGKPLVADGTERDRDTLLLLCTAGSLLFTLGVPLVWGSMRRARRQQAPRAPSVARTGAA